MRIEVKFGFALCLLLAAFAIGDGSALAFRASSGGGTAAEGLLETEKTPQRQLEGACGVAISPNSSNIYVSDYYHRAVEVFTNLGQYIPQQKIALAGGDPVLKVNTLNAVCGLAFDSAGNLYANEFHQNVMTLPGEQIVDSGHSTGLAVDEADNVYVDDRTYVAEYEAPVVPGEAPLRKIGVGSLGDAYGLAVFEGRVYVADVTDETIEVFEPGVKLSEPVATIDGPTGSGFNSLADATIAVDASSGEGRGHLLVVDNLKPLYAKPEAAVYEFDSAGNYLERLQDRTYEDGREVRTGGPIFGEPSGMFVDPSDGRLYVTTGNSEGSNVLTYGPYQVSAPFGVQGSTGPSGRLAAAGIDAGDGGTARRPAAASASVVVQRGPVRVSFDGKLTPHKLPRHGTAPVGIAVDTRITGTGGNSPPQLRRIAIAINRNGRLSAAGLPVCGEDQIQPSTTAGARAACGDALVGEGHFAANVKLPEQSPFPSSGKVLAFNGRLHGRPAILAHIYGTQPAPTSYVLPFSITDAHGTYGTVLEASLPQATGDWGYVTGLKMTLRRSFRYRGRQHSYLSAGCPAPAGFPGAVFPLARTSFAFAGGPTVVSVLNRSCTAKG